MDLSALVTRTSHRILIKCCVVHHNPSLLVEVDGRVHADHIHHKPRIRLLPLVLKVQIGNESDALSSAVEAEQMVVQAQLRNRATTLLVG